MTLDEIKTDAWQLSSQQFSEVVTDLADINQCILMIVNTQKGSDPVSPLFGIDLMKWIDAPVTVLIPNLINEITRQVGIWEKRAEIIKVTYLEEESHITFTLEWTTTTGATGLTKFTYNG